MKKTISQEGISSLCLELSLLLHAGVTVGDALALLSEQSEMESRPLLSAMAEQVEGGEPLSAALRSTGAFPAYVCGLVEVGERAGRTEEALAALSEYYENRVRRQRRIRSALLYPAIMLTLMLVVIAVLLVKVLPIFSDVYASLGGQLTGVAGGLLSLGRWLDSILPILFMLLVLVVVGLIVLAAIPSSGERLLGWWHRRRSDRGITRKMNDAILSQALAMGMSSGLPLDESLTLAASLLEDAPGIKARCRECTARLDAGAPLSDALRSSHLLPAAQCRLLELGQRSGMADTVMTKIAADLSAESEAALEARVSRVEPALVLVCSVLVGLILLSVMLPLMHIMSTIG